MPSITQTQLCWGYAPTDFFEGLDTLQTSEGTFTLNHGNAIRILPTPIENVEGNTLHTSRAVLDALFAARQLQTRRPYQLNDAATILQHSVTGLSSRIITGAGALTLTPSQVTTSIAIKDANTGEVRSDTGELRRQADADFITTLAPKLLASELLRKLAASFHRAAHDPDNELVYLYEIKDALTKHFGGVGEARRAFADAGSHIDTLGRLANSGPLQEGRHRGSHLGQLRPATAEELRDARQAALELILGFAKTLP
jgi:hypothetical protein